MGGEEAPDVPVRAAREALTGPEGELEVLLVGDPDVLDAALERAGGRPDGLSVVPAGQTVADDEPPARSVRRKPDSSIAVGLRLQRDGAADAFVSAGSTGAVVAGSMLVLGSLEGVDRPALGAVVPTAGTPALIVDVGANVSSRPRHLRQFARLGAVYVREVLGVEDPAVGLLNVGEEEGKGDEVAVEAHELLRSDGDLRFAGNVEGDRIIRGVCDVLVCDGFLGNVLLKFYESIAGYVAGLLEEASGGRLHPEHRRIRRVLDYAEYGGAPLLGVDGVAVVCHGASSSRAVRNAVGVAARAARSGIVDALARGP
jgi:glycerol-3-phosphate acyltransferase PlsX